MIFLIYSIVYLFILLITIYISKKLSLTDIPNERKIHNNQIPFTAGLSIFIYLLCLIKFNELNPELENIIIISFICLISGLVDDKYIITPGIKLTLLSIPTLILIYQGYTLDNLGTYEIIGKINLGKLNFIFTLLCVVFLINAFNYNDGIDGLALSQIFICLIYYKFLINNPELNYFLNLILISIIITFFFNFSKNIKFKIFLGNGGSLMLGFVLSFFIIYLFKYENIHPGLLIWPVAYLVYEFLSVSIIRLKRKKNIFIPGKDHFHHLLLKKFNNSHFKTTGIISLINIIFIFLGILIYNISNLLSLIVFIISFFSYLFFRIYIERKLIIIHSK